MVIKLVRGVPVVAALILGACTGSSSEQTNVTDSAPQLACSAPITSSLVDVVFSAGCESCSASDAGAAADSNPSSAAVMHYVIPMGESALIRATGSAGQIFAANTEPGAYVAFPEGENGDAVINFILRTYRNGVLQDASDPVLGASLRTGGPDGKAYYYVPATQPFDTIEFEVKSLVGAPSFVANVFQLCSDY